MNFSTIKSLLPYVMIYFLIFKDPYKYIIPVNEPRLKFTPETTWLLDDSNKTTHFATAYNLKFKEKIHNPNNSFPYFIKAFDDANYSDSTKKILGDFKSQGENLDKIVVEKNNSIENLFIQIWSKNKTIEELYFEFAKEDQKLKIFDMIDKINIPEYCKSFDMPHYFDNNDLMIYSQKSMLYTFYLGLYALKDEKKTIKALGHCRLLANQPNPVQLICSVQVYQFIIKTSKLSPDTISNIEEGLPDWPNLTQICTQVFRSQIISTALYRSKKIETMAQEYDKDLFLDKNIYLKSISDFCAELEKLRINATLNNLSVNEKISFLKFVKESTKEADKRPLAEIVLFSGNSTDRHQRLSNSLSQGTLNLYLSILIYSIKNLEQKDELLEETK